MDPEKIRDVMATAIGISGVIMISVSSSNCGEVKYVDSVTSQLSNSYILGVVFTVFGFLALVCLMTYLYFADAIRTKFAYSILFTTVIITLLLIQLSFSIFASVTKEKTLDKDIRKKIDQRLQEYERNGTFWPQFWILEREFACCGFKGYKSYKNVTNIPGTCCLQELNDYCTPETAFKGCSSLIENRPNDARRVLSITSFSITMIQSLSILIIMFTEKVKKRRDITKLLKNKEGTTRLI